jgi:hypothetical protein
VWQEKSAAEFSADLPKWFLFLKGQSHEKVYEFLTWDA